MRTISFSHDGALLASASEDMRIDIGHVETTEKVDCLKILHRGWHRPPGRWDRSGLPYLHNILASIKVHPPELPPCLLLMTNLNVHYRTNVHCVTSKVPAGLRVRWQRQVWQGKRPRKSQGVGLPLGVDLWSCGNNLWVISLEWSCGATFLNPGGEFNNDIFVEWSI